MCLLDTLIPSVAVAFLSFFCCLRKKGEKIPKFSAVDISFFAHLMKKIEPDCPGFVKLHDLRNRINHSTFTEIQNEDDMDDMFIIMEEAVNAMFSKDPLRQHRRKWREVLHHIQTDDIDKVEPQTKGLAGEHLPNTTAGDFFFTNASNNEKLDAQRRYVVSGTLALHIIIFVL